MARTSAVDYLIVGAGVAGLRAAVELARHGDVLVVTKESVGESNTHYAQGGIAVALKGDEDIALHLEDTVNAGDGLVYRPAAEALVTEGPLRVAELIEWGANFDREAGELVRTREGAHSLPRILHSSGDATGAEISRSLAAFARVHPRIRFAEWTMVTGLIVDGGRVIGAELVRVGATGRGRQGSKRRVAARAVLIASGGAGQVYSDTTNPAVATGDGIALAVLAGVPNGGSLPLGWKTGAPNDGSLSLGCETGAPNGGSLPWGWKAGAELADMEFYQFHPTAFAQAGAPRFLISEALRGEGAWLRNERGERFMERVHPLAELAPRDVVARAIAREAMGEPGESGSEPRPVYLDMRHVRGVNFPVRFPGISAFLARYGLDLARDLIPVRPAAHYLMGGIRTDLGGRTSLGGLYAAGEAACTGVHGANRLASNSLLEGLVFGARAARSMLDDGLPLAAVEPAGAVSKALTAKEEAQVEEIVERLRSAMWTYAGLLRDEAGLRKGLAEQKACAEGLAELASGGKSSRRLAEALAMSCVAHCILMSALARTESRGAHFRNDYPRRDDQNFRKHSVLGREGRPVFEEW